jgi:hypothetical protein
MKTIYDASGNEITIDAVDAREYIETGQWFAEKPSPVPAPSGAKHKPTAED